MLAYYAVWTEQMVVVAGTSFASSTPCHKVTCCHLRFALLLVFSAFKLTQRLYTRVCVQDSRYESHLLACQCARVLQVDMETTTWQAAAEVHQLTITHHLQSKNIYSQKHGAN